MTQDRRYDDDEVAAIFELATEPASRRSLPSSSSGDGMTLAQLQEIGREVGLPPERIAEAASALEVRRRALPRRRVLGVPVGVAHVVDLPRAPTDAEWERIVADLRQTFGARGTLGSHGGLREWANGNLHAFIEPGAAGQQLRLTTTKGDVAPFISMGLAMMFVALIMAVAMFVKDKAVVEMLVPALFAAVGATAIGVNLARLPGWAGTREEQFQLVGQRTLALLSAPADDA